MPGTPGSFSTPSRGYDVTWSVSNPTPGSTYSGIVFDQGGLVVTCEVAPNSAGIPSWTLNLVNASGTTLTSWSSNSGGAGVYGAVAPLRAGNQFQLVIGSSGQWSRISISAGDMGPGQLP